MRASLSILGAASLLLCGVGACDSAYSTGAAPPDPVDAGASDATVEGPVPGDSPDGSPGGTSTDASTDSGDSGLLGTSFCARDAGTALFCADFDESTNVVTGWTNTDITGSGTITRDTVHFLSAGGSAAAAGSKSTAVSGAFLITPTIKVPSAVTLDVELYLTTLPASGVTWTIIDITFDNMKVGFTIDSTGKLFIFGQPSKVVIGTGKWTLLELSATAMSVGYKLDSGSGSVPIGPGPFSNVLLEIGVLGQGDGKDPASINFDNVFVR